MLEKTAASLDQCGLHRVLPSATASLRSTRQLHTNFWQHGATVGVELSPAWQALMHGTVQHDEHANMNEPRKGVTNLSASSLLLDFLYPNGAVALMRRWASAPGPVWRTQLRPIPARLYTSSADRPPPSQPKIMQAEPNEATEHPDVYVAEPIEATEHLDVDVADPPVSDEDAAMESESSLSDRKTEHREALARLLAKNDPDEADQIWIHYKALGREPDFTVKAEVMALLSSTGRLADAWKVSELFNKIDPADWDDRILVAGIAAEIQLQNTERAAEIFGQGLSDHGMSTAALVHALDMLLDVALRAPDPKFLLTVWSRYPEMAQRFDLAAVAPQLRLIAAVPDLANKVLRLKDTILSSLPDAGDLEYEDRGFDLLQRILIRRAVTSCASNQVLSLLELSREPMVFEEFLNRSASRRQYTLGTEVWKVYRTLPGNIPSRNVMYEVFKDYTKMSTSYQKKSAGIEELWSDWHAFHGKPSLRAYQRYLSFYAGAGDKNKVHQLWIEYVTLYADENVLLGGSDTFAHLLHVHAVLGEVHEVQRIFDDMVDKFLLRPNLVCWNILLDAYARAGDYDKTAETFQLLATEHRPDRYSYGTMMQMAGSRGDLGFTTDLYRKARSQGLRADAAILSSLVDAYCQNELWSEAQDVCVRASQLGPAATRIWNKLLFYHALRRDLAKVNELLQIMADNGVPYNLFTYQQLLLALSLCRQADHALHMLSIGLRDNIFEVTPDHFYIVMGAFIRTGEIPQVLRLSKLMKQHGFHRPSKITFILAEALAQWRLKPSHARSKRVQDNLRTALSAFRHIYFDDSPSNSPDPEAIRRPEGPPKVTERNLLATGSDPYQFGTLSYLLAQLQDFEGAKDLVRLYQRVFENDSDDKRVLPVPLLNSVIAGYLAEGNHEGVWETWTVLFSNARKKVRTKHFVDPARPGEVSPKYRYVLCHGLKAVLESMLFLEDAAGMQGEVEKVLAFGFALDSKTWNFYVQGLIQLHEYKQAFTMCEQMLMPGWRGWFRARAREAMPNQLPLNERRKGNSPRYLRPTTTTLYRLAKGYMDLDKMAPWSKPAGELLKEIEDSCEQTMRAINSIMRIHSPLEYDIFGSDDMNEDEYRMEDGYDLREGGHGEMQDDASYEQLRSRDWGAERDEFDR